MTIEAEPVLGDCSTGDSISVNGTCLTVTSFTSSHAVFGVAPETLRRTSLGELKEGDKVCLERACKGETRMGGHLVQGHVDCVAQITEKKPDGEAYAITFKPRDQGILKYVVEKGYICLDGASLTGTYLSDRLLVPLHSLTRVVTRVDDETFSVMIIAYTQQKITLGLKDVGEVVNVEVDQVGKYIERMIAPHIKKLEEKLAQLEKAS